MRQGIAIVLLTLMFSVSCRELVHFAVFKLNQEYITKVFCINRAKPELKCDGKCYLKKSIDASKEERKSKPASPPDEKSIVLFYDFATVPTETPDEAKSNKYFTYLALILTGRSKDIHHPPDTYS